MFVEDALAFLSACMAVQGIVLGLMFVAAFNFMEQAQTIKKMFRSEAKSGTHTPQDAKVAAAAIRNVDDAINKRRSRFVVMMVLLAVYVGLTGLLMLLFMAWQLTPDLVSYFLLAWALVMTIATGVMIADEVRNLTKLYDLVWELDKPPTP